MGSLALGGSQGAPPTMLIENYHAKLVSNQLPVDTITQSPLSSNRLLSIHHHDNTVLLLQISTVDKLV